LDYQMLQPMKHKKAWFKNFYAHLSEDTRLSIRNTDEA